MPTSSYDLIVLGDDLAGLIAAALAARRGMRTLVLGFDDRPSRYSLGTTRLPVEPLVMPGRGGAFDRATRELNLEHTIKRRLRESRVPLQLVGPDQRIDVTPDGQTMARELGRELPAGAAEATALAWNQATEIARAADPLLAGDAAFPGVGFWERREVARQADKAAADAAAWWAKTEEAVGAAGGSDALALLRLPAAIGDACIDPSPLALARSLDSWRAAAPALKGDLDGLVEMLGERLTSASGERRAGHAADIGFGWSKITSVRTDLGEELGVSQVIATQALADLVPLLGKKAPKKLVETGDDLALAGWRYVVNLVVDESAIPEGMAPTVLAVVEPDAPLIGDNAFAVHLGETDEHGRVVVTISAVLAAPPGAGAGEEGLIPQGWLDESMAKLRGRLIERVEMVMPFVGEHLVLAHSPNEAVAPIVPGGRGGHEPPKTLPVPMRALWRGSVEHGAGIAALPYGTGVKNLTLASRQVMPQLGLEGTFATGWSAAKIVCALAGKKRDYLKDEVVSA